MTSSAIAPQLPASAPGDDPALDLLLGSSEPAIRHSALTRLLGRPPDDDDVVTAREVITKGPIVSGLLAGQRPDGSFGNHPYAKWGGAHWRLVSLVDLGVPPDTPGLRDAASTVLDWLSGEGHARGVKVIDGRARTCGSKEGNALAVATYLGMADDPRARHIAANLVRWQWPDGGWNCDKHPNAAHSSFNESLPPLLGLSRYGRVTGDSDSLGAADRVAEFLLQHRILYSHRTGQLAHPALERLCYPPYWHYDALAALKVLFESGHISDQRTSDALNFLEGRRHPDGTWHVTGYHWKRPGSSGGNVEVVDWGRGGPSEPLTLGALVVLESAGRRPSTPAI
jgi:hypothetical protein